MKKAYVVKNSDGTFGLQSDDTRKVMCASPEHYREPAAEVFDTYAEAETARDLDNHDRDVAERWVAYCEQNVWGDD